MNKYSGSNFDDFLAEEGILEEVSARALKRLLALQVGDIMTEANLSKTRLAEKLFPIVSKLRIAVIFLTLTLINQYDIIICRFVS